LLLGRAVGHGVAWVLLHHVELIEALHACAIKVVFFEHGLVVVNRVSVKPHVQRDQRGFSDEFVQGSEDGGVERAVGPSLEVGEAQNGRKVYP